MAGLLLRGGGFGGVEFGSEAVRLVGLSTSIGEHGIDSRQLRLERVRARLSFLSRGRRCEFGGFQSLARVRERPLHLCALVEGGRGVGLRARSRVGGFRVRLRRRRLRRRHSFAERLDLGTRFRERRLRRGVHRGSRFCRLLRGLQLDSNRLDLALEAFLICLDALPFLHRAREFLLRLGLFLLRRLECGGRSPRALRRRLRLLQRALEISDARRVLCRRRLRGLGVHGAFVLEFGDARFKRVLTSLDVCERCAKMLRLSLGGVYSGGFLAVPRSRVRVLLREPRVRRSQRSLRRRARVLRRSRVRLSRLSARHRPLDRGGCFLSRALHHLQLGASLRSLAASGVRGGFEGVDPSPGLLSRGRRCEFGGFQSLARVRERPLHLCALVEGGRGVGLRARSRVGGFRVRLRRRRLRRRHSFAERLDLGTRFRERRLRRGVHRGSRFCRLLRGLQLDSNRLDLALEAFLICLDALPFLHRFRDLHGELLVLSRRRLELFPHVRELSRSFGVKRRRGSGGTFGGGGSVRSRGDEFLRRASGFGGGCVGARSLGVQFGGESRGDLLLGVRASVRILGESRRQVRALAFVRLTFAKGLQLGRDRRGGVGGSRRSRSRRRGRRNILGRRRGGRGLGCGGRGLGRGGRGLGRGRRGLALRHRRGGDDIGRGRGRDGRARARARIIELCYGGGRRGLRFGRFSALHRRLSKPELFQLRASGGGRGGCISSTRAQDDIAVDRRRTKGRVALPPSVSRDEQTASSQFDRAHLFLASLQGGLLLVHGARCVAQGVVPRNLIDPHDAPRWCRERGEDSVARLANFRCTWNISPTVLQ